MRPWRRSRSRTGDSFTSYSEEGSEPPSPRPTTATMPSSGRQATDIPHSGPSGTRISYDLEEELSSSSGHPYLGEALIPIINKIQDIFNEVSSTAFSMELPQVAVVGSQSSGKSSVLEALVGRDFLPRGPDICTRRPLVLQMVKSPSNGSNASSEWGEFLHLPGKRFYDFERIRAEILAETDRVVGQNRGVSDKPIRLKICSPHVLTMTLVDLPGITRVPVGDQPADIEQRIREMILEYICMDTCIILAVTACNSDLANSDSLQLARQVDPEGVRTIGVLTKLDIMDRGTDASEILRNRIVPLRLGYVGVVNRSQHDININKGMAAARDAERIFFESHPAYNGVVQQCGVAVLAKTLNAILVQHIQALLPGLRQSLEAQLNDRSAELASYGEPSEGASTAAQGAMLLRLVTDYADAFTQMVNGSYHMLPTNTIAGGARVRYIFKDIFQKSLQQLSPSQELTDEDIRTTIRNSGGVKGSLMIPEEPFEILTRRALEKLRVPSRRCYELVLEELLRMVDQCMPREFMRFPILERRAREVAQEFIIQGCASTEKMIRNLLDIELSYINTDHPRFIGGSQAVAQVFQRSKDRILSGASSSEDGGSSAGLSSAAQRGVSAKCAVHHSASAGSMPSATSTLSAASPAVVAIRGGATASQVQHSGISDPVGLKVFEPSLVASMITDHQTSHHDATGSGTRWFTGLFGITSRADKPPADGESMLVEPPLVLQAGRSGTEQEHIEVDVTRLLVQSYFDIVRSNLQDTIPKAVMHFLVVHAQKGLQQHLIVELYKEELFQDMMSETDDISRRRAECIEQLSAARRSLGALDELPRALSSVSRDGRSPLSPLTSKNLNNAPLGFRRAGTGTAAALMASAALQMDNGIEAPPSVLKPGLSIRAVAPPGNSAAQREVPRKTTSTTTQPQGSAGHPLLVYRIAF